MVWVALLRAINLGARNKVPMAGLREALEEAGFPDVRTYIQSGNVVFDAKASDRAALARKLERTVEKSFGVKSTVILRKATELRKVARAKPFGADTSSLHVSFLAQAPGRAAVRALGELDIGADKVKVVGSDVYVDLPNGVQGAKASAALLERTLGVQGTMRNFRTVSKLAEIVEGGR